MSTPFTVTFEITSAMSAEQHGNAGFPVLATPALLGLFERAAIAALASELGDGEGSVGTSANLKHLAATPIGQTVVITASLTESDGKRRRFVMKAKDEAETIAECDHERFIVNVAKFTDRLRKKAEAAPPA